MKQNFAEKIKLLKDLKKIDQIYKIIPILTVVSFEELDENIKMLNEVGITISHIYEVKICALNSEELHRRLDYIRKNSLFDKYIKNPLKLLDSRDFVETPLESVAPKAVDSISMWNDDITVVDNEPINLNNNDYVQLTDYFGDEDLLAKINKESEMGDNNAFFG